MLTLYTKNAEYPFNGPHKFTSLLNQQSGVYAISTHVGNGSHKIIDIGESDDLRYRVTNHDRKHLWPQHEVDGLFCSAFYCDEPTRMTLEKLLRSELNPPCGIR